MERIKLLVARYRLLVVAQHQQEPMSVEEALSWVDLALPMKTWLYNEDAAVSSLTGASCLLQSDVEWPLDHVRSSLKEGAVGVIEKLVFRDFWTGECLSRETCKWMPLIPCKYVDVRNMVCVNPRVDASSAFQRLLMILPKTGDVCWESVRADTPLPDDELPLKQLPQRHPAKYDSQPTLVCDQGEAVLPRSSVLGWTARVYTYLVDKYGRDSVPADYCDEKALVDFCKLERTYEEFYFELLCSRLTGDFNPLVLLDAPQRYKYAQYVLQRPVDERANPLPREFEFTVTATYEKRMATVVDNIAGDTLEVDVDDPDLDPAIREALEAYTE